MASFEENLAKYEPQLVEELQALVLKYDDLFLTGLDADEVPPDSLYAVFVHAIGWLRSEGWEESDLIEAVTGGERIEETREDELLNELEGE